MNNWNNSYVPNFWDRMSTNINYVTSLEEALSRSNMRNSENVYFHQDNAVFYRVKVDYDGRKSWQEFHYDAPKQVDNTPVVKQDILELEGRIKQLENMLFKEFKDEQPNGQISVSTVPSSESSTSNAASTT